MREEHLSRFGVDACGVGLKARHPGHGAPYHHGEHRRHITLAACHIAIGIETGQCPASRVADGCQQVETPQGEALQTVAHDEHLERFIDTTGILDLDFLKQLVHRDVNKRDAQPEAYHIRVGMTGNEPVGRLSDDAESASPQTLSHLPHLFQDEYAPTDIVGTAMDDLTAKTLLSEERQNLHRCGERIAFTRREQEERTVGLFEQLFP